MPPKLIPAPSGDGFSDILPDSMIEEILLRLPLSSVFAFRCVSTQWLSLTTSRYFIKRWELHHAPFLLDPPLALVVQKSYSYAKSDFFLLSGVPKVKLSYFSLDFYNGFRLNSDAISVMGSCEDLSLWRKRERFHDDYFVVNVITRQWIALPRNLGLYKYVIAGFVCEPASIAEARKRGELRYRVVLIPIFQHSKTKFNVEIFSSEDGQWNEYVMALTEGLITSWLISIPVACNGILYWNFHFGGVKVIAFDPFNPKKKGIELIQNAPDRFHEESKDHFIGICQGKLRMSEISCSQDEYHEALRVNIWELDYGESKWHLVQVVQLQEILAANSSIVHPRTAIRWLWSTLAFHPSDKEIIYFYLNCIGINKVICCNLKRMSLEIVMGYDFSKCFGSSFDVFPFLLPWWPTPVSTLPCRTYRC